MSLVLNTNVASLNATRNLQNTQNAQNTTFQRLSTGLRINSAKDDAAGLYLAQAQTKDIRGLAMATRNASDGISMAQTAEGALDQIQQNLQRINELAIQSANGTYNNAAREGLQKEVDQLTQEINRIVETTEFNGEKILNRDAKESVLQIGFRNEAGARISAGLEGGLEAQNGIDNKTFFGAGKDFQGIVPDVNGKTDNVNVRLAFAQALGMNTTTGDPIKETDDLGDDNTAGDKIGNSVANALKDFQGDAVNLAEALFAKYGEQDPGPGEHKFSANGIDYTLSFKMEVPVNLSETQLSANYAGTTFNVGESGDLDVADATLVGFGSDVAILEIDTTALNVKVEDSNALNSVLKDGLNQTKSVDISTQAAAQNAITASRNAIDQISELRATFGAIMNRFEAVISGNQIYSENLSASRSRIQDADFATETSNLSKQQVLQQAGLASLSQANAAPQAILSLLG